MCVGIAICQRIDRPASIQAVLRSQGMKASEIIIDIMSMVFALSVYTGVKEDLYDGVYR
jgi:hypothetical protein